MLLLVIASILAGYSLATLIGIGMLAKLNHNLGETLKLLTAALKEDGYDIPDIVPDFPGEE